MKKLNAIMAAFVVLAMAGTAAFVVGCKHMDSEEHGSAHVHQYTCKMHPEVVQDSPGNCPQCGMKLVHKDLHSCGGGAVHCAAAVNLYCEN